MADDQALLYDRRDSVGGGIRVSCVPCSVHSELLPQMGEPRRVHGAAVLQELPQTFQPSLSEERRLPYHRIRPDLDQAAYHHNSRANGTPLRVTGNCAGQSVSHDIGWESRGIG
jgi:hypothetical protein